MNTVLTLQTQERQYRNGKGIPVLHKAEQDKLHQETSHMGIAKQHRG